MPTFGDRLKNAWNAFTGQDRSGAYYPFGERSYIRPDRPKFTRGNERTIVTAIFTRIAMDVSAMDIKHVRLDNNGRFKEEIDSNLNSCLNLEANLDQTGRAFLQDVVMTMFDEGCVAIVPTDTIGNPYTGSYDITKLRTGKIVEWCPDRVKVSVYRERTGKREEIYCRKDTVAIVENPLYSIVNEPNSTMQRLIRKLALLDEVDKQLGSGKLDMIISLPYSVRTETKRAQAEARKKDIETQLNDSKYGIAYIDQTEKITQLNRPLENNLMGQVEYLTNMVYSQLGITTEILNGTASDQAQLNYTNRILEPILCAIVEEMRRKFLTKTARTQKQTIMFFRDPFKLVPVNQLAELADKFTRNEIMTSNEFRQIVGMKPSDDPNADQLRNKNLNQSDQELAAQEGYGEPVEEEMTEEPSIESEKKRVDDFIAQFR